MLKRKARFGGFFSVSAFVSVPNVGKMTNTSLSLLVFALLMACDFKGLFEEINFSKPFKQNLEGPTDKVA